MIRTLQFIWAPVMMVLLAITPFYRVRRYVLLARHGAGEEVGALDRWWNWFCPSTLVATAALNGLAALWPDLLPRLRAFMEKGGLVLFVPLFLICAAVLSLFTPGRALRRYDRSQLPGKRR